MRQTRTGLRLAPPRDTTGFFSRHRNGVVLCILIATVLSQAILADKSEDVFARPAGLGAIEDGYSSKGYFAVEEDKPPKMDLEKLQASIWEHEGYCPGDKDDHRKCAAHRKRAIALEKEDDSTTPDYEAPEPFDPETKVVRLHSNVRLGTFLL